MRFVDLVAAPSTLKPGRWALVYATVDTSLAATVGALATKMRGAPVFGCTSSRGVFTPRGFERGAFALIADEGDPAAASVARACSAVGARRTAREAALAITQQLGRRPDALLLHATPGFEERLVEGLEDAFDGQPPPTYGGSAADDDLSGGWRVFSGTQVEREGFVLAGFVSEKPVHGSFVAGYVPGKQRGTVTRAKGRVILEIDHEPAAVVYNRWRAGALDGALGRDQVVLGDTTLHPIGRVIDRVGNVPRHLLSHPHEIRADGSLSLFTDIVVGDEIAMMVGSEASLLERTEQVVTRALGSGARSTALRAGILVYCGGCVMAIGDRTRAVSELYRKAIGGAPFVGAATFGEIGCFTGPSPVNRHGNLMCDTILFE